MEWNYLQDFSLSIAKLMPQMGTVFVECVSERL